MKEFKHPLIQGPAIVRIDEQDIPYILFTSDLHLHHKNILHYTKRLALDGINDIDSMEAVYVDKINNAINNILDKDEDALDYITVFNCGDFIFSQPNTAYTQYIDFRKKIIPTTWYNVIGNHDIKNILGNAYITDDNNCVDYERDMLDTDTIWYWNNMYILEIYRNAQRIAVMTISHMPMQEYFGYVNIHGHLHTPEDLETYNTRDTGWAKQLRADGHYIDVGVDRWDGNPVRLSDILEGKTDVQIKNIPQLDQIKWQYEKI